MSFFSKTIYCNNRSVPISALITFILFLLANAKLNGFNPVKKIQ